MMGLNQVIGAEEAGSLCGTSRCESAEAGLDRRAPGLSHELNAQSEAAAVTDIRANHLRAILHKHCDGGDPGFRQYAQQAAEERHACDPYEGFRNHVRQRAQAGPPAGG